MDNLTRTLRANRRPGARAIAVAAALLLLPGLGTPGSPTHAGPVGGAPDREATAGTAPRETAVPFGGAAHPGHGMRSSVIRVADPSGIPPAVTGPPVEGPHTVLVWDLAPEDQPRAAAPPTPSQEPEVRQETTEGTETESVQGHRFLSPGLLGLTALVAVTALVGAYLTIRSRRRSRKSKETEE